MSLLVLLFAIFSTSFAFQIGRQIGNQLVLDRFDNACGKKNLPITFSYSGMRNEGNSMVFNGTMNVTRDVSSVLRLLIKVQRCENKENPDTCERFYDYNTEDYCKKIENKLDLFGMAFSTFHPKYKCPIKKGIYRSVDTKIDMFAFFLFPADSWYWKVHMEVRNKNNNALMMCIKAYALITA